MGSSRLPFPAPRTTCWHTTLRAFPLAFHYLTPTNSSSRFLAPPLSVAVYAEEELSVQCLSTSEYLKVKERLAGEIMLLACACMRYA